MRVRTCACCCHCSATGSSLAPAAASSSASWPHRQQARGVSHALRLITAHSAVGAAAGPCGCCAAVAAGLCRAHLGHLLQSLLQHTQHGRAGQLSLQLRTPQQRVVALHTNKGKRAKGRAIRTEQQPTAAHAAACKSKPPCWRTWSPSTATHGAQKLPAPAARSHSSCSTSACDARDAEAATHSAHAHAAAAAACMRGRLARTCHSVSCADVTSLPHSLLAAALLAVSSSACGTCSSSCPGCSGSPASIRWPLRARTVAVTSCTKERRSTNAEGCTRTHARTRLRRTRPAAVAPAAGRPAAPPSPTAPPPRPPPAAPRRRRLTRRGSGGGVGDNVCWCRPACCRCCCCYTQLLLPAAAAAWCCCCCRRFAFSARQVSCDRMFCEWGRCESRGCRAAHIRCSCGT